VGVVPESGKGGYDDSAAGSPSAQVQIGEKVLPTGEDTNGLYKEKRTTQKGPSVSWPKNDEDVRRIDSTTEESKPLKHASVENKTMDSFFQKGERS